LESTPLFPHEVAGAESLVIVVVDVVSTAMRAGVEVSTLCITQVLPESREKAVTAGMRETTVTRLCSE
jgi:hypothetical protein